MWTFFILLFTSSVAGAEVNFDLKPDCKYDHDTRTYYCTDIYDQFPKKPNYGNYHLKCQECFIKVFSKDTFPHENYLVSFNLSGSGIEYIAPKAFAKLGNLNYLYLQNNHIVNISADAFYGLRQIYELILDDNELEELTPGFVNGFEANSISLARNRIKEIPANVFKGIFGTMSLYLNSNKINILHLDSFAYLNGLEVLSLKNNHLCFIPLGIFKHIQTLRVLDLSQNKLKKFSPGTFSALKNLLNLNVSYNEIVEFDPSILLPLPRLLSLDVSANGLYYLDYVALHTNVPSLRYLSINDNSWSCPVLTTMVQYFKKSGIDVSEYSLGRYEVPNIFGIVCTDKIIDEKISFAHFMKIVDHFKHEYVVYCK